MYTDILKLYMYIEGTYVQKPLIFRNTMDFVGMLCARELLVYYN